jgi:hypothetical protein
VRCVEEMRNISQAWQHTAKLQWLVNVGGLWTHALIISTTRTKEDCDDEL